VSSRTPRALKSFTDRLWDDRQGLVFVRTVRCHSCSGRRETTQSHTFSWPDEQEAFFQFVRDHKSEHRIFAGVLLRDPAAESPSRAEATLPGPWAWVDIDHDTDLEAIELRLAGLSYLIVTSGRPGHCHIYVRLPAETDRQKIRECNEILADHFEGDRSPISPHAVLAIPWTYNHRGCETELGIRDVEEVASAEGTPSTAEQLRDALGGASPTASETPLTTARNSHVTDKVLPRHLEEILKEDNFEHRSQATYKQVMSFLEMGIPHDQIVRDVSQSALTQEKFGDRAEAEVQRVLDKFGHRHDHAGDTCTQAGCPNPPDWLEVPSEPRKRPLYTLEEFLARDLKQTWLVDGIVPAVAYGTIAGPAKTFKTVMLLDLAISVASGSKFLGHFDVHKSGPVLLYANEGTGAELTRRSRQIMNYKALTEVPPVHIAMRTPGVTGGGLYRYLRDEIEKVGPELVILDPWYGFHGSKVDVTNLHAEGELLRSLEVLCNERGATLLIANHFKKNAPLELSSITQAGFSEWPHFWLLTGARHAGRDATITLKVGSRPGGEAIYTVNCRDGMVSGEWATEFGWEVNVNAGMSFEDRVLKFLRDHPGESFTTTAIRMGVTGNNEKIGEAIASLLQNGKLNFNNRKYSHLGS
jgi:hypothetical protein